MEGLLGNIIGIAVAFAVGVLILWLICKLLKISVKIIGKLVINALIGFALLIVANLVGGIFGFSLPITFFSALFTGVLGIPGVVLLIVFCVIL